MPVQALALLDALAGEGGPFWEAYTSEVLPQPDTLALPFCLPPRLLQELQHEEVAQAALVQKVRLQQGCAITPWKASLQLVSAQVLP